MGSTGDIQNCLSFIPSSNDKILAGTKFKANCRRQNKCCSNDFLSLLRVENTVGKGENAGYQHFLLFSQCFPKPPLENTVTIMSGLLHNISKNGISVTM